MKNRSFTKKALVGFISTEYSCDKFPERGMGGVCVMELTTQPKNLGGGGECFTEA